MLRISNCLQFSMLLLFNTAQAAPLDTLGLFVRIRYNTRPIIDNPTPTIVLGPNSI
jgi:hypothetical protein